MYIVPIAWLYVAFMMSAAEATNTNGSVLGAVITFVLYGVFPVSILMYIMGTPGRKRLLREKEKAEAEAAEAASSVASSVASSDPAAQPPSNLAPDAGRESSAKPIPAVGEKP